MAKVSKGVPVDALQRFERLVAGVKGLKQKGATMPYVSVNGTCSLF
jgi:hypothetical protein